MQKAHLLGFLNFEYISDSVIVRKEELIIIRQCLPFIIYIFKCVRDERLESTQSKKSARWVIIIIIVLTLISVIVFLN